MKCSIVIPSYNHCEDLLKPCIESIIKFTDLKDIEVIVSANGCTDGTRAYVESLGEHFKLVWSDKPTGFTIGTNDGIKVATGEYIILLSNDTILLDQGINNWIEMLLKPFEDPRVGITGPMMIDWESTGRKFLIFFCVAVRKKLFDELGLLDEIFNPGFGEDVDYCFRATDAGYKLVQVPNSTYQYYAPNFMLGGFPIFHKGEVTLRDVGGVNELLVRNTEIVKKKYPLYPEGFFAEHDIDTYRDFFKNKIPMNGIVAELGCFKGRSLASVADIIKAKNITVVAVDPFVSGIGLEDYFKKEDVKAAFLDTMRRFDLHPQVLCMSSHEASTHFEDKYFDFVFIDAEHTYECIRQDCQDWWPKVKSGGLLAGHDVLWEAVARGLGDEFGHLVLTNWNNIWYINKPYIYDCFPFCNELDQLEIRLNELDKEVDYFVLVEGTETHQGKPKPLYFNENKQRFAKFLHKIKHIVVSEWPEYIPGVYDSSWSRERFQRDSIIKGLNNVGEYDILILGDADEITSAKTVRNYRRHMGLCKLELSSCFYFLNYISSQSLRPGGKWQESRIVPVSFFRQYAMTPCSVRYSPGSLQYHHIDSLPSIPDAGWHFSFQGGIDAIMEKIKAYAHQEFNRPDILDRARIERLVNEGKDVFGREEETYSIVPLDESFPRYVLDNKDKFKHMIKEVK